MEEKAAVQEVQQHKSARSLYKAIFDSNNPEQYVRTLPAQSIYLALLSHGVRASTELIAITTVDQTRVLMDLDLWEKDRLNEEHFWEWLSLTDDNGDFAVLHKVLKAVDLKLLGIMISRYVDVTIFDEPTENPPINGMHTPDNGYTWLVLKNLDADKHFFLARFLALIFETSAELFYQLLSIPGVATESSLEEEAYQERAKRIVSEGIPDADFSTQINSPLKESELRNLIASSESMAFSGDIIAIDPLIFEIQKDEPLRSLIEQRISGLEEELSLILNAALVHFNIELWDSERVALLISKVKGAIGLGFAVATELAKQERRADTPAELTKHLGLQAIYQTGLGKIIELRKLARKVSEDDLKKADQESILFSIVAFAREPFPGVPNFLAEDGTVLQDQDGKLVPGERAIVSLREIEAVKEILAHSASGTSA